MENKNKRKELTTGHTTSFSTIPGSRSGSAPFIILIYRWLVIRLEEVARIFRDSSVSSFRPCSTYTRAVRHPSTLLRNSLVLSSFSSQTGVRVYGPGFPYAVRFYWCSRRASPIVKAPGEIFVRIKAPRINIPVSLGGSGDGPPGWPPRCVRATLDTASHEHRSSRNNGSISTRPPGVAVLEEREKGPRTTPFPPPERRLLLPLRRGKKIPCRFSFVSRLHRSPGNLFIFFFRISSCTDGWGKMTNFRCPEVEV